MWLCAGGGAEEITEAERRDSEALEKKTARLERKIAALRVKIHTQAKLLVGLLARAHQPDGPLALSSSSVPA